MQLTNILCRDLNGLPGAIAQASIQDSPELLILVFTGVPEATYIGRLLSVVGREFPHATLLGATTAGEMTRGEAHDRTTVLSFCRFADTRLSAAAVGPGDDDRHLGRRLALESSAEGATLLLSFLAGPHVNGDQFIQGVADGAPGVPLAGGVAGDNHRFRRALVFDRERILTRGAAGVALHSPTLEVSASYSLDWLPLGQAQTVTAAQGMRIHTIAHRPAREVYERFLGRDLSTRLPGLGLQFPIIVERKGRPVARTCLAVEPDGSILCSGTVFEGDSLRFALGDPHAGTGSTGRAPPPRDDSSPDAVFAFASSARRRMLKSAAGRDARHAEAMAPSCGFYTYGEFFSADGENHFFSHTLTTIGLSEAVRNGRRPQAALREPVPTDTQLELRAMSHLVSVTQRDIEHANATLEHLATTDPLTQALNRRKMTALIDREIGRCRRYSRWAGLILLDIDRFKTVNDRYGHDAGDRVLITVSDVMDKMTRNTDFLGRWGGEEFLILSTETSAEAALALALRICERIAGLDLECPPRVTASLGVTAVQADDSMETVIKRADKALYTAKRTGRNRVCVEAGDPPDPVSLGAGTGAT